MTRLLFLSFILILPFNTQAENVTNLANNGIKNWESKIFFGETLYTITDYKGKKAIKAISDGTGSGLLLKKKIDLQKTPFINWSWLIENKLPAFNEREKEGDDFAARVYLIIDGGIVKWNSKSVSYVWSSNEPRDQIWNNAYLGGKLKMISVKGKNDKTGQWFTEKRNVYQDLIKTFGDKGTEKANLKAYRYIDVVAIMTDTDNSKSKAETYFSDIIFSEQ